MSPAEILAYADGADRLLAGQRAFRPAAFSLFEPWSATQAFARSALGQDRLPVVRIVDELGNGYLRTLLHVPVQTLLVSLNLPSSTILRKMARAERLSPAESDRVAPVLYVRQLAVEVFEDPALAVEWMQRSNAELGGLSALDVLDSYIRWYNEKRIKISLGALSPVEYRESLGLTA